MVSIIDYGVGNLFSLNSSLKMIGVNSKVTDKIDEIKNSSAIILPGVGAFSDAAEKLKKSGLDKVVIEEAENGKPLLGICLGMQMLFTKSYEYGEYDGLNLIQGDVVAMEGKIPSKLKIPHIGWNALKFNGEKSPLFKYINNGEFVYFVHSFYADNCSENIIAVSEYGMDITAAVQNKNIFGCQFHPEKSGETGLKILKAFCEMGEKE